MKRYHIRTNDHEFDEFAQRAEKMTGKPAEEIKQIFSTVKDVLSMVLREIDSKNITNQAKTAAMMSLIQNIFLFVVGSISDDDENDKISVTYSLLKNPLDSLGLDIIIKKREGKNDKDN